MNDVNELQQLLDFYDKNVDPRAGYRPPTYGSFGSRISSGSGEMRPGLLWAQTQMAHQQQAPDFFSGMPGGGGMGGQQQPYAQPQQFGGQQPSTSPQYDGMRPGVTNYLKQLLGARNG